MALDGERTMTDVAAHTISGSFADLVELWRTLRFNEDMNGGLTVSLDSPEGAIVWQLGRHQSARPSALAREIGLGAPAVTKALARLDERGLTQRENVQGDGRGVSVRLSTAGLKAWKELDSAGTRVVREALSGWTNEEAATFMRALGRFTSAMSQGPDNRAPTSDSSSG